MANPSTWMDLVGNGDEESTFFEEYDDIECLVDNILTRINQTIKDDIIQVAETWAEIGLQGTRKRKRVEEVIELFTEAAYNIKSGESKHLSELRDYRMKKIKEINHILADLSLPEFVPPENLSLLCMAKRLHMEYENWSKVKEERIHKLMELKSKRDKLCKILATQKPFNMKTGIPSDEELMALQSQVTDLMKLKNQRLESFIALKKTIETNFVNLERTIKSEFETNILYGKIEEFVLSAENLSEMQALSRELDAEMEMNKSLKNSLVRRLQTLFSMLQVDQKEQQDVLQRLGDDHKPSTIKILEEEIDKYQQIRKDNLKKFIELIRDEIQALYSECFQSHNEEVLFEDDEVSEQTLQKLEIHLQEMKAFKKENSEIIRSLHGWNKAWIELYDLERVASDPARLTDRKYNLLQEEKKRKRLQKEIPLLEKKLQSLHESYFEKNSRCFLVRGVALDMYLENVWEQYLAGKENEKIERQMIKKMILEAESQGRTPIACQTFRKTPGSKNTPISARVMSSASKFNLQILEKRTPLSPLAITPTKSNITLRKNKRNIPVPRGIRKNLGPKLDQQMGQSITSISESDFQNTLLSKANAGNSTFLNRVKAATPLIKMGSRMKPRNEIPFNERLAFGQRRKSRSCTDISSIGDNVAYNTRSRKLVSTPTNTKFRKLQIPDRRKPFKV